MTAGDLVVDFDALYSALSFLPWGEKPRELMPFVASARDAVYQRLKRTSDIERAWIITTEEQTARRLAASLNGKVIHIQSDEDLRQSRLAIREPQCQDH